MIDLLVRNGTVVTLDPHGRVLPRHTVAVTAGRITSIEPSEHDDAQSADHVVDASGQFVLPGLINTHTHVGQAYFKGTTANMGLFRWLEYGWFYIQRMTTDDIYWSALLNLLEMIKAGVTTFCDMYFYEDVIARAAAQSGLRACVGEAIMEPGPGMEARMPVDEQIAYARDVHRQWHGAAAGRIQVFMAPHSLYLCSAATMEKVLAAASALQAPIEIHLSETRHEIDQARQQWGLTPPERMAQLEMLDFPIVAAHCVHLTPADIDLLDRPSFGVAHNPASNLKLQSGRAPIEHLVGRRLAVGLGSDGCGSNDVIDILKEAYLAALLHPWREDQPAAYLSLALATREGARALGLQAETGSLEVGKKADLIVVATDAARTTPVNDPYYALAYTAHGDDVVTTIVDGQVLMESRVVKTLDEAEILAQARARARRLFAAPYPGGVP